jgi:hypothetical protein
VFNIQKAVSRLDYAPKLKEIQVTDIKKGIGVFTPKPDKPVSFAALKETLKKAGYKLDSAGITITGTLAREGREWLLIVAASGQRFTLEGSNLDLILAGLSADAGVEIKGEWKATIEGTNSREVVVTATAKKAAAATSSKVRSLDGVLRAEDAHLRREDADLHRKDRISHRQDHDLHAKDGGLHAPDYDLQAKDGVLHAPDYDLQAKDGVLHAPDYDLHAKDGGLHAPDYDLHAKDGVLHAPDYDLQAKDGVLHAPDYDLHAKDGVLHAPDYGLHAKNGVLHAQDGVLQGKDGRLHRQDGTARRNGGPWAVIMGDRTSEIRFMPAVYESSANLFSTPESLMEVPALSAKPPAPIRVTSPGLTVYKGGAVTPRLYFIKQHLGKLEVSRQAFDLSVSYTPSPRVQLEVEVPVSRTSFRNSIASGSTGGAGTGLGNITLWSKYRFFRKVKTYGDRQAAARFGLELPTGKNDGPSLAQLDAPAFVRQQLTPINGGLSPHFDLAFSQAGGRFIFGGNAEVIVRSERDGFRMGHEVRVSTDTEYVLLPRKYVAPGRELFVILETTLVHRGVGRMAGASVAGSNSTEYYLAPGIQFAMAPQFVIEGSFQFPVIRNTGPLVLRTDRNILLGVRYLF